MIVRAAAFAATAAAVVDREFNGFMKVHGVQWVRLNPLNPDLLNLLNHRTSERDH